MLPQLSSLTHLGLAGLDDVRHCPDESLSAITFSSCLQQLHLNFLWLPGWQDVILGNLGGIQHHTWQHIFPDSKKLLQLTSLSLGCIGPHMTHADLQACVSCCPRLQALDVAWVLEGSLFPSWSPLLQLSGLTSLTAFVPDSNLGALAQLTGLQALSCELQQASRRLGCCI